jgi:hypothetical protein
VWFLPSLRPGKKNPAFIGIGAAMPWEGEEGEWTVDGGYAATPALYLCLLLLFRGVWRRGEKNRGITLSRIIKSAVFVNFKKTKSAVFLTKIKRVNLLSYIVFCTPVTCLTSFEISYRILLLVV